MRRLLMSEQPLVLGYQHFHVYYMLCLLNYNPLKCGVDWVGHTATVDVRTTISDQGISIRHENLISAR